MQLLQHLLLIKSGEQIAQFVCSEAAIIAGRRQKNNVSQNSAGELLCRRESTVEVHLKSKPKIGLMVLGGLLGLGLVGFVIWASLAPAPMPEALAALISDSELHIQQEPWLEFTPTQVPAKLGLIIYPGGKVDPLSYAPLAREIARAGFYVAVPSVMLHMAVFSPNRAAEIIQSHPDIHKWVLAGHSLGGVAAAGFAATHPQQVQGLVFWASYPSLDLKQSSLSVLSIYATEDGLATPEKVKKSEEKLPVSTQWTKIIGGNHAQFGWYGPQSGDGTATISRLDQQNAIVQATVSFLQKTVQ
jgi:hypothetical protein